MTSTLDQDRRRFLKLMGSTALASALSSSIVRATGIAAHRRTGTIEDVEHIVILMQENRSFDHYFGCLRGVRGFGDPRPVRLPSGDTVWHQPAGEGCVLPFHPDAPDLGLQFLTQLPHDWNSMHAAWNGGHYDQWVPAKGHATMMHLTREDIPFHYALADAFTVCDAYHCSLLGPTDPNRYYMWSGWTGNDGRGGGPDVSNGEIGYSWRTFPERLQDAGINWKVYQDTGIGLDTDGRWGNTLDAYIGNYGDNALLYFTQYRNASPDSPLYQRARTGTRIAARGNLFEQLRDDVMHDRLPQVSWIISPEAYSEHPNFPPNYGAWYTAQVLDALTGNPEVFAKTALFITYDENDGLFDHVVPPCPPPGEAQGASTVSIANELFPGDAHNYAGPFGMGARVPMIVVSPWSKGGWVCSQVFDHTSLIRFIERRFERRHPDLREPNITPWRRAVAGDLTTAFDFSRADGHMPPLPATRDYRPPDRLRYPNYIPHVPADQHLPTQEPGMRPARALPYELHATAQLDRKDAFGVSFGNTGAAGACFQVRTADGARGPWYYTVEAGKSWSATWPAAAAYDYSVHGPNGFMRRFRGNTAARSTLLGIALRYGPSDGSATMELANDGMAPCHATVENVYDGTSVACALHPGERRQLHWPLTDSHGWYDLIVRADAEDGFVQRLAGHVETGRPGVTDPAMAQSRWMEETGAA